MRCPLRFLSLSSWSCVIIITLWQKPNNSALTCPKKVRLHVIYFSTPEENFSTSTLRNSFAFIVVNTWRWEKIIWLTFFYYRISESFLRNVGGDSKKQFRIPIRLTKNELQAWLKNLTNCLCPKGSSMCTIMLNSVW